MQGMKRKTQINIAMFFFQWRVGQQDRSRFSTHTTRWSHLQHHDHGCPYPFVPLTASTSSPFLPFFSARSHATPSTLVICSKPLRTPSSSSELQEEGGEDGAGTEPYSSEQSCFVAMDSSSRVIRRNFLQASLLQGRSRLQAMVGGRRRCQERGETAGARAELQAERSSPAWVGVNF